MATSSSIKKEKPRLQPIFGILTQSDDDEIRSIFQGADEMLLNFAEFLGSKRAGWEGTGFELTWLPSGQIEISSFVESGLDGDHCVSFGISLRPAWFDGSFPQEPEWQVAGEVNADCQHTNYCGHMHCVYDFPPITATHPVEAVRALRDMTEQVIQLGKEKPIEYWLQLTEDTPQE
jgi:hypothetical protein